ncbi:c-type cytochrome [Bradyrhizobium sp. CB82]|uniref:c-type cytochrome n=1 Tax=Bradyrhizobium sp. CB82 TaxID=3039159 RepID=UPI0032C23C33
MKLNAIVFLLLISCGAPAIARQDGATLYATHCAQCHDSGDPQSRVSPPFRKASTGRAGMAGAPISTTAVSSRPGWPG